MVKTFTTNLSQWLGSGNYEQYSTLEPNFILFLIF